MIQIDKQTRLPKRRISHSRSPADVTKPSVPDVAVQYVRPFGYHIKIQHAVVVVVRESCGGAHVGMRYSSVGRGFNELSELVAKQEAHPLSRARPPARDVQILVPIAIVITNGDMSSRFHDCIGTCPRQLYYIQARSRGGVGKAQRSEHHFFVLNRGTNVSGEGDDGKPD